MENTQHTQGEWKLRSRNLGGKLGFSYAVDLPNSATIFSSSNDDAAKANMMLVSAGPDMLTALELCVECLSELARLDDGTPSISAWMQARAAIAKATEQAGRTARAAADVKALREMIDAQIHAARRVVDNWASGDLAGAVNELQEVAQAARTLLDAA